MQPEDNAPQVNVGGMLLMVRLLAPRTIASFGYIIYLLMAQVPREDLWSYVLGAAALGFLTMIVTAAMVMRATSARFGQTVMALFFPYLFCFVPAAGQIVPLYFVYKLLRGQIGAVVSSTRVGGLLTSVNRQEKVVVGSMSRPAGLVILAFSAFFVVLWFPPDRLEKMGAHFEIPAREVKWDRDERLKCEHGRAYLIKERDFAHGVSVRDRCRLRVVGGTLSRGVNVSGAGSLHMEGGKIAKSITVSRDGRANLKDVAIETDRAVWCDDRCQLTMEGGSIKANKLALLVRDDARVILRNVGLEAKQALEVEDKTTVIIDGGSITGRGAIKAEGDARLFVKDVAITGKTVTRGRSTIVKVAEGEDPVAKAAEAAETSE